MLPEVQLPFLPSAIDCLAWSEDRELAIAAGEFVHILASQITYDYRNVLNFALGSSTAAWKQR